MARRASHGRWGRRLRRHRLDRPRVRNPPSLLQRRGRPLHPRDGRNPRCRLRSGASRILADDTPGGRLLLPGVHLGRVGAGRRREPLPDDLRPCADRGRAYDGQSARRRTPIPRVRHHPLREEDLTDDGNRELGHGHVHPPLGPHHRTHRRPGGRLGQLVRFPRDSGAASRGCDRNESRRPRRLHRVRFRPELCDHELLPRQRVRDGLSGRVHRIAHRRDAGKAEALGGHVPGYPGESGAMASVVPVPADRPVGHFLRRGDLRDDAPDYDRLPAGADDRSAADRTDDPDLHGGPVRGRLPEPRVLAPVGADHRLLRFVLDPVGRLRAPDPTDRRRGAFDQPQVPQTHGGRPAPVLLSVHARLDGPHRCGPFPGPGLPAYPGVGQLLELACDGHPTRGDLPESAAPETGAPQVVVLHRVDPEHGLLRVLLRQLRGERRPLQTCP